MFSTSTSALSRLLCISMLSLAGAALAAAPAWAQSEKKEPGSTEAKAPAKDAKDSAKDSAKQTKDTAGDTAKSAKDAPKDTAGAKDAAKDTPKSTKDSAKETAKEPRDSARDTRDTARQTTRDARDTARDSRRDVRDAPRDARDLRERTDRRDVRDRGDIRDDRDVRARDLRDERDVRTRDSRDERDLRTRDLRDDVRDLRDRRDFRDTRDVRDRERDIDRRDVRSDARTTRDTRVTRSQIDNFRAESVTARDVGVTFGRATDRGLVIQDLSRSAVLADLGFRRGDVIVAVDDRRVASEREFFRLLFAGDLRHERITIIVLRDSREVPIYVRPLTIIEELVMVHDEYDPLHHFGVVLDDRIPDEIVVLRVIPDSPAFVAGIRAGDVITTFRGQRIMRPQQFVQVIERVEPGEVAIEVNRDRRVREFTVEMPRMERRATGVRRSAARPDFDIDRPAIERREERREERRDGVPGVQPIEPAQPAPPAAPRPLRPGILPRNR